MWSIGQTLWDKEKKELVCYLGIDIEKKKNGVLVKKRDGSECWTTSKKLTHICDLSGEPAPGKFSLAGCYFGIVKKEYRNGFKPDESIYPDNKNYFLPWEYEKRFEKHRPIKYEIVGYLNHKR